MLQSLKRFHVKNYWAKVIMLRYTDAVSALAASFLKISAFFLAAVTFFELTAVCAEISGSSVVCTCKLELSMKLYLFRDG